MAVYKRGRVWWYKFTWNGEPIRESTKQTNKRVAEQIEAAHKTSLAKGEVGIRDRVNAPTLQNFIDQMFRPFIDSRFLNKPKTLEYYNSGLKHLCSYGRIATARLDKITVQEIAAFIATRREKGYQVTSINRQLEVLRRLFKLAMEWEVVDKVLPKVQMLPGERRRERVLRIDEENLYLEAAEQVGSNILEAYRRALEGLRAKLRGEVPIEPADAYVLRDVTTILIDCGLRPEECFRLEWEYVRDGELYIPLGKTAHARRKIPLSDRAAALLEHRRSLAQSRWVFSAPTRGVRLRKGRTISALYIPAHVPHSVGRPYGPVHARISRWA